MEGKEEEASDEGGIAELRGGLLAGTSPGRSSSIIRSPVVTFLAFCDCSVIVGEPVASSAAPLCPASMASRLVLGRFMAMTRCALSST